MPRGKFILLELLHFAEDVKELRELGDWKSEAEGPKTSTKEVDMAERLIADMTSKWDPDEYKDTYRVDIMKRVKAKVSAGKATEITEEVAEHDEGRGSKVIDLMPLLRKSLAQKKSPGASKSRRA